MAKAKIFKPWFIKATDYLWNQRRKLPERFEDPDYGGMPEELYKPFSGAFILVIQDLWDSGSSDRFHQYKDRETFLTAILNHHAWNPIEVFDLKAALREIL
jgi:hypothetical protein